MHVTCLLVSVSKLQPVVAVTVNLHSLHRRTFTKVNSLVQKGVEFNEVDTLPINSMEQRPSWQANRPSASQEMPWTSWNPQVHYRIHNSPPSLRPREMFCNAVIFYSEELLAPRPKPELGDHPMSTVHDFFQHIRGYSPWCKPFLHPQREDEPCRGDRNRLLREVDTAKGWKRRSWLM